MQLGAESAKPYQLQYQQPFEDCVVTEVQGPANGHEIGGVELLMGEAERRRALVVEVAERMLLHPSGDSPTPPGSRHQRLRRAILKIRNLGGRVRTTTLGWEEVENWQGKHESVVGEEETT